MILISNKKLLKYIMNYQIINNIKLYEIIIKSEINFCKLIKKYFKKVILCIYFLLKIE